MKHTPETVVLLDFGCSVSQKLARSIRDNNIYTMKFDVQNPDDGYSADWHPSITTHDKAAEKLTAELRTILGR